MVNLKEYLPSFLQDILELEIITNIESEDLDQLLTDIQQVKDDMFIATASEARILRTENFLRYKGLGTLEQRKNYLISLFQKGKKLNSKSIRDITNAITGSECLITFYTESEIGNPNPGFGLLRVQVLSPDPNKDYRYADIVRALGPLVPGHIKLLVVKYFATWEDIKNNYTSWAEVKNSFSDWQAVKSYTPQ
jgi:hypothetical protein